jgi:hypothetical protein
VCALKFISALDENLTDVLLQSILHGDAFMYLECRVP